MRERDERDSQTDREDPDASPWLVLALGVVLALLCLILIARLALAVLAG
jgi:hypothetical protein